MTLGNLRELSVLGMDASRIHSPPNSDDIAPSDGMAPALTSSAAVAKLKRAIATSTKTTLAPSQAAAFRSR
jgi:hypothetical protein